MGGRSGLQPVKSGIFPGKWHKKLARRGRKHFGLCTGVWIVRQNTGSSQGHVLELPPHRARSQAIRLAKQ